MNLKQKITHAGTELKDNITNKEWLTGRINHRINSPFQTRIYPGRSGADIPNSDWDVLIVLDGCREDLFRETMDTTKFDEYQAVESRASATNEWLNVNFQEKYGDIVYLSANPMPSRHKPDAFHKLYEFSGEDTNSDTGTVPPQVVTERAIDVHRDHQDKRLIVHYIQPHIPFIQDPDLQFSRETDGVPSAWKAIGTGLTSKADVWEAYRRNLEYVMPHVWKLISEIDGRIVVTSDHGNLLGERTFPIPVMAYGHPEGIRHRNLTRVPWAVINKNRLDVRDSGVSSRTNIDTGEINERLKHLGYK